MAHYPSNAPAGIKTIIALCPICSQEATFEQIGEQRWPELIAERLAIPALIRLYQCRECRKTLTHLQLGQE